MIIFVKKEFNPKLESNEIFGLFLKISVELKAYYTFGKRAL